MMRFAILLLLAGCGGSSVVCNELSVRIENAAVLHPYSCDGVVNKTSWMASFSCEQLGAVWTVIGPAEHWPVDGGLLMHIWNGSIRQGQPDIAMDLDDATVITPAFPGSGIPDATVSTGCQEGAGPV